MTDRELRQLTKKLSKKHFQKPFHHTVKFNNRLRTTGGRYIPVTKTIEINPKYLQEMGLTETIGIIKHELCHYHLHITGKAFQENDLEFINLLKKTNSPAYCRPLPSSLKRYIYQCSHCNLIYKRKRRVNVKKYKCGNCFKEIQFVEIIYVDQ